jgi:hypothetical protein
LTRALMLIYHVLSAEDMEDHVEHL